MEFQIETNIKDDIITQELFEKEEDIKKRISTWVLNTRDEDIKNALIDLGWTPPPDK